MKPIENLNLSHSAVLLKCLEDLLPSNAKNLSVHGIQRLTEHGASAILYSFFLTDTSNGLKHQKNFLLKLYREVYAEDGSAEFTVLKTLKEHNLPVPTPYCLKNDNSLMGNSFMIMEKIVGERAQNYLNNKINSKNIIDKMAKTLVKIHKLNPHDIQGFNFLRERYLTDKRKQLALSFFIKKYCMGFLGFFPVRQRRFIAAVKRLTEEKQEKFHSAILHMGYEPNHVLVSNEQLTVLDWGAAAIGDPACDVGWTYHLLRLGGAMFEVDLGKHFVDSYEKYNGQKLVNLQFWKDMSALKLATLFCLSPFCDTKLLNYGNLIDLNFGYVYGKLREAKKLHRLQRLLVNHHTPIYSDFENNQRYILQYLERDRWKNV
ncbi:MAG TPA: aminoglycoside phosphotransferase family protein [Anaerovoracaceae bacterium]|nr:aminoglycoside phosphotransferase family protein [Anaerovoracaceae bacterium]